MIIAFNSATSRSLDLDNPRLRVRLGTKLDVARPGISFVRIEEGSVELACRDGSRRTLNAGEMALVRHCEVMHVAAERLRALALTVPRDPGGDAVTPIVSDHSAAPFPVPDTGMLVDGVVPKASASIIMQGEGLMVGVWESTPYHRKSIPFPRHEFMHLLHGAVTFQPPSGESITFSAGDSFLVPCGFVADWKQTTDVRKVFFIVQPEE